MITNLHLHNLDDQMVTLLEREALDQNISLNTLMLRIIKQHLKLETKKPMPVKYYDLDKLAGTWSAEEFNAFNHNIEPFGQIDGDLWR
jgi:hypothetical protein